MTLQMKTKSSDVSIEPKSPIDDPVVDFTPVLRSGAWADIGSRSSMEDVYVCADNFLQDYRFGNSTEGPNAFYGVITFPSSHLLASRVAVF